MYICYKNGEFQPCCFHYMQLWVRLYPARDSALSLQTCLFHCRRACNLSKNILISHFHDDDIWLYNYQNSFGFFFRTEICQSCWGLNNNSSNLGKKTTNWTILFIVIKNDVIVASLSHIVVFFWDVTEPLLVLIFSKKVRVEDKT